MAERTFNIKLKDGDSHELLYDNRALYEFEGIHGDTAMRVMSSGNIGFRSITHLVWAGLQHNEYAPSIDEVIDLVPADDFEGVVKVVMTALEDALGLDKKEKAKAAKKAKAGRPA